MDAKKRKFEILFIIFLACILFLYYFSNLKNISVIWELPDEAGYLYNAAYFAKKDWTSYASLGTAYYGYGYSLILVPLFYICKTSLELIKAVIALNYIMVICIYIMQIYIFSKMFRNHNLYVIAIVSFITNLFPYIVVSANKVLCEIYLLFQVWTIAIIIYKLLITKKQVYCAIAAIAAVYIYYIHTRAIAITAVVVIFIVLYSLMKRDIKGILIFSISLCISYYIGNLIKESILISIQNFNSQGNADIGNVINSNFILQRLSWLFNIKNVKVYIISACCRSFYIVTSTGLSVIWFLRYVLNNVVYKVSEIKSWKIEKWILLYFGGIFGAMFLLCCLSGAGISSDFTYTFYGRYIEYVLVPVLGIGMLAYLEMPEDKKNYAMIVLVILGIISAMYINYLDTSAVRIDTARIAGFSYWIGKNNEYQLFVYSQTLLLAITYAILATIHRKKSKKIRFVSLALIMVVFLLNDKECKKIINGVNNGKSSEIEVAEFLNDNIEDKTIYYINREYDYKWNCTRMQALLLNQPMIILNMDDYRNHIIEDSYIIAYTNTKICDELSEQYAVVLENKTYCIYEKK